METSLFRLLSEFKQAGVKTVAVFTVQDVNSEHVRLADEVICIGDTPKSYYSDWQNIISAAEIRVESTRSTG